MALGRMHAATLTLTAPLDYQVIQRETRDRGNITIEGRLGEVETKEVTLEARIATSGKTGEWRKLPVTFTGERFSATMASPAGGWHRVEVRAFSGDRVLAGAAVEHVGVGEVFVVAGQSNAANYGQERQSTKSGQVVTFDGEHWQLCNDPQPGAGGAGGSFLPPFGDAMAQRFGVPVGFVACGIGATSVREWLPKGARFPNPPTLTGRVQQLPDGQWESKGEAFDMLVARMKQMGPRGFRAVLWHQGESDANQPDPARTLPGRLYYEYLKNLIRESRRALGWEPPWFVAQVSYHVPGDEASADIRAAQASLWTDGIALAGPDSDALRGDLRENDGKGVHFSGPGLRAHAASWVDKVAPWLEQSRPHRLTPVPIQQVVIQDDFWSPKLKVWREVTIADCFTKFENDRGGAINNFDRVRDGQTSGHAGPEWYDGLIYEMIRGSADFLASCPDAELEKRLDGYIDRIAAAAAKDPNGYLNTWTQLTAPDHRWGLNGGNDVKQHDVYNASAMVEAAVHYYRATGKTRLLQVATKLANHMADVMGPPPKQNVVPGHSLGEEALVKLYLLFREKPELKSRMPVPVEEQRYLKLAEFWIENRGNHEGRQSYGAYAQDHKPVLQQETIEGHAVRATLLCAGLAAAANVNEREDYLTAARRLWNNMVERRMYVIGGLGAVAGHEGFGPDFVLPNNGYLETCAAIGAGFFHQNMNLAFADARYADELERVLYNGVLSGVSLKGDSYFYENPLEAGKNRSRWAWHGCPCCPPMFLKIMGALPGYIYAQDQGAVYVNLFVGSLASLTMNGTKVIVRQTTRYPWDGAIRLSVEPERQTEFAINLRLPAWCADPRLMVNGKPLATFERVHGYARLQRKWRRGDRIDLSLPMTVQRIKASPQVEADIGRVALQRGPIVYCLEAVDNGGHVRNLVIPPDAQLKEHYRADLLGGVTVIRGPALGLHRMEWRDTLYLPFASMPGVTNVEFTAIPYFANANRQPGEMMVWMADTANQAEPLPSATAASRAIPSASHCWRNDAVSALNDQIEPAASDDMKIPRFTWWDHRGTKEWVQYDFEHTEKVSAVQVYWWDERRLKAHCRVPQSWRLLYQTGGEWKPVAGVSAYTTEMDQFNRVTFAPVETKALRIEVQLQLEWSGGILEWRVEAPGS
jgi:DUF1680 family protein